MNRSLLGLVFLFLSALVASAQSTCESFSQTINLSDVSMKDATEHGSGDHGVATGVIGAAPTNTNVQGLCTYTTGATG